ncbi:helix-turn-helix transcriptional regulator [Virgibacillus xinjiangensis]|uniref:Helix-turn-helix transcriptional regulator n=1 Tax=Virgibacillus xinjiangensis TaxID=393090 RepID=A0ABV7CRV3_9BACI
MMEHMSEYANSQKEAIEYRYRLEEKVMHIIQTGNVGEAKKIFEDQTSTMNHTKVSRIPSNPLRDRKNGLIIRNTFYRIAAKNGGLPPLLLHYISEKYALLIERAESVEYLDKKLAVEQLYEYTEAVNNFSTNTYSGLTKQVASYIMENFAQQITLQQMAEQFHVHPSHLSRKFKQETTVTVMDYIHIHRINHAKLLFQEGNANILEVATMSGFNSSSYFNRIFKKVTNQTPSMYIKNAFEI